MKLKRFNESIHEDYIEILYAKIKKDNKNINGFKFNYDEFIGTFEWYSEVYSIYATPYWDDSLTIPIDIYNVDGDMFNDSIIKLKELTSQKDVDNTINYYYEIIDSLTLKLNKITELKNIIQILLKKSNSIKIDNIIIKSIDDIKDLNLEKLIDIYDVLNKQYPELFLISKYNI